MSSLLTPLSVFAAALMAASLAFAEAPPEVARALPEAEQVGAAPYEVLAWRVFDASLWAEEGAFSWSAPFALALTYARAFSAETLADRSIHEMAQRSGQARSAFAPLKPRLEACFADVRAGDRITGVSTSADSARFYLNGRERCVISSPGFSRAFFGIWLDARGGQRAFSRRLTGQWRKKDAARF